MSASCGVSCAAVVFAGILAIMMMTASWLGFCGETSKQAAVATIYFMHGALVYVLAERVMMRAISAYAEIVSMCYIMELKGQIAHTLIAENKKKALSMANTTSNHE